MIKKNVYIYIYIYIFFVWTPWLRTAVFLQAPFTTPRWLASIIHGLFICLVNALNSEPYGSNHLLRFGMTGPQKHTLPKTPKLRRYGSSSTDDSVQAPSSCLFAELRKNSSSLRRPASNRLSQHQTTQNLITTQKKTSCINSYPPWN